MRFDGKDRQVVINLTSRLIDIQVGMLSIERLENSKYHWSVWPYSIRVKISGSGNRLLNVYIDCVWSDHKAITTIFRNKVFMHKKTYKLKKRLLKGKLWSIIRNIVISIISNHSKSKTWLTGKQKCRKYDSCPMKFPRLILLLFQIWLKNEFIGWNMTLVT